MTDDWKNAGFGVYVHWPFCQAKCPYCDFNSHVSDHVDQTRWAKALAQEVQSIAEKTPRRRVDTVFFGGGTPSLMQPETVQTVLNAIAEGWQMSNRCEVTLEANPTSVEARRFKAYAEVGVNRISMGIQSLKDDDLRALGRLHSAQEARQAFDIARKTFANVSFDLIYARQDQSREAWAAELDEALEMAVDHISAYQLTIEPGTAFGRRHAAGRLAGLPSDGIAADMYDDTQAACAEAGLPAYEISNHARPGRESRHNLIYWRYGDYAGIGPGAHGRLSLGQTKWATETPLSPDSWLTRVERDGTAVQFTEQIAPADQLREYVLMSIRLTEGTDLSRCRALFPSARFEAALGGLVSQALLTLEGDRIRATSKGRRLLNAVLSELVADV